MAKNVKHTTRLLSNGHRILADIYPNIGKKQSLKMVNSIWKKLGKPFLAKTKTSLIIPSHGMELIRVNHRGMIVCQLTGGYSEISNPSLHQLKAGGVTHFYNEMFDIWVDIDDAIDAGLNNMEK